MTEEELPTTTVEEAGAEGEPRAEESRPLSRRIAEVVRERSRVEARLTPVALLRVEGDLLDTELQEALIEEIAADEVCRDIKLLRTSAGAAYLYSADLISETYARILLRLEEDNPHELIAATVREESETYPRPTTVELFRLRPFGLGLRQVEQLVGEMALLEQYRDVKPVRASTGALYLYSDRYMDAEWARSLVEREEVEAWQNP